MSKIWTDEERLLAQFFLSCGWKYIGKDTDENGDVRRGFALYRRNPWKISEGSDFPLIYRVSDNFQTEIGRMSRNPHLFDKVRNSVTMVNLNDIALDLPYANISTDAMNWINDVLRVCGGDPDRDEMDIAITADCVKRARFFNPVANGELLCSVKVPAYVSNGLMMEVRYKIDSLHRKYERDQNSNQNS